MTDPAGPAHSDPYARIAEWYDAEHDAFEDDLQFYRDLAAGVGPTILEVGCGSGRVTVTLARMGRAITGIDPSAAMLARCRARLAAEPKTVAERVRLVHADLLALGAEMPSSFALAIVPLNTFAHFTTPSDRLAALAAVRERVVPGGLVALDLDLAGPRRLLESPGQLWLLGAWEAPSTEPAAPDGGAGPRCVQHFASAVPAAEPDAALVTHIYDAQTPDGVVRRTVSRMTLALLTRNEVQLTLERAGYTVEAVYGSYELDPYQPGDERAIFVAHT
jgi:SAM-dependent methyltransferase